MYCDSEVYGAISWVPPSSAVQVRASTTPVAANDFRVWKLFTALSVRGPNSWSWARA
ncbi:hypothetical protein [Calidifontibacter indicus]|uniref:hypothetical protein n=1 Tax=Calidifontibacter indicus TaxID=419650 RepID=UPI003D7084A4